MNNVTLIIRTKVLLWLCCMPFLMNAQIIGITMETINNVPDASKNSSCPLGDETTPEYSETFEMELVELINKERRKDGKSPLKRVERLTKSSRFHAKDMADNDYFSHDSNSGCTTFDRIGAFYPYNMAGENIAAGFDNASEVHDGFVNSPSHLSTMLNASYREVGVGFYWNDNASGNSRWVENFGTRSNIYPVIINDEQIETESEFVIIYAYGSDVFDEIRLKNENGDWSDWTTFTTSDISWEIEAVEGVRTVHVEMRTTGGGSTASASDEISYKGPGISTGFDPRDKDRTAISKDSSFDLFPNPTQDIININAQNDNDQPEFVQIINSVGQVIKNMDVTGQKTGQTVRLNVRNFDNGIYFARVSSQNSSKLIKFVIAK